MLPKQADQPARAEHLRAGRLASSAQLSIRGHDDAPAGELADQGHDRVITGAVGLDDPHACPRARVDPGGCRVGPGGRRVDPLPP